MNPRVNVGKVETSIKIKRAVWNVVCAIFFRPFATKVFRLWRVFLLKCFGAEIDWGAEVYASAKVWAPWNLKMEKGACVGPDAIVYNQAMVSFGENACLSQYAYVCTAGHGRNENDNDNENEKDEGYARKFHTKVSHEDKTSLPINNAETGLIVAPVTLHRNSWIGTRAYINMGVEIGENAIVGACACVFKDVEAGSVVGGNPAEVIRRKR